MYWTFIHLRFLGHFFRSTSFKNNKKQNFNFSLQIRCHVNNFVYCGCIFIPNCLGNHSSCVTGFGSLIKEHMEPLQSVDTLHFTVLDSSIHESFAHFNSGSRFVDNGGSFKQFVDINPSDWTFCTLRFIFDG